MPQVGVFFYARYSRIVGSVFGWLTINDLENDLKKNVGRVLPKKLPPKQNEEVVHYENQRTPWEAI